MKLSNWWVLLLAAGITATGCGTDEAASGNNNNREEPNTEVPQGARLLHTGNCANQSVCALDLSFESAVPLRVQLVNADNQPVDNTSIIYDINDGSSTGSSLSAAQSVTDASGTAEVEFRSGATAGVVNVRVSAGGANSDVNPIQFQVAVNAKGSSSYRISFNHQGGADLKDVVVRAFPASTTCEQIRADYRRETTPGQNPTLTAITQGQGTAQADGTLPLIVIPDVPNGTAYTFEARGKLRSNNQVDGSFGCKDGNPAIENGESVNVTVDLVDNLPQIGGVYDVNHTFNLIGAVCGEQDSVLPDAVCTVIGLLGDLATNPASFLIGDGMGSGGILGILLDFLPDGSLKDGIEGLINNGIVSMVLQDELNDFLQGWLDNNAPSWLSGALDITADIYESLEMFEVVGIIRINEEPTPQYDEQSNTLVGLLAETNGEKPGEQVWSDIIVFWEGECPANDMACRRRQFSANDLGVNNVVRGDFTGTVIPHEDGGYALQIDEHTLQLNFGVLILGIVEKVIFPSIFGPDVDTLSKAINSILSAGLGAVGVSGTGNVCEDFGVWADENVPLITDTIAENACNGLLDQAANAVEDLLVDNLTVGGEDNFLMATPVDNSCRLIEPDLYAGDWVGKPLPYADSLGTATMKCAWDVKIKISSTNTVEAVGEFHGTRDSFLTQ